ncbi:hypothetical protein B0T14DRAFT_22814 [Immersiella caudata]|uniref:Uncharacterized protein n=1 Tax=Immersiella caudata TaxID=314043 RepID=A0AA39XDV8_9PEZI|nr:hypothetical protein B0T14DRAFT_22814 [Immersiella caudata]
MPHQDRGIVRGGPHVLVRVTSLDGEGSVLEGKELVNEYFNAASCRYNRLGAGRAWQRRAKAKHKATTVDRKLSEPVKLSLSSGSPAVRLVKRAGAACAVKKLSSSQSSHKPYRCISSGIMNAVSCRCRSQRIGTRKSTLPRRPRASPPSSSKSPEQPPSPLFFFQLPGTPHSSPQGTAFDHSHLKWRRQRSRAPCLSTSSLAAMMESSLRDTMAKQDLTWLASITSKSWPVTQRHAIPYTSDPPQGSWELQAHRADRRLVSDSVGRL